MLSIPAISDDLSKIELNLKLKSKLTTLKMHERRLI